MMNELEAIKAAIDQKRPGFRGGFISSKMLENSDAVGLLGYVPHPALPGGRCRRVVAPDDDRPVLYVYPYSAAYKITENVELIYECAQDCDIARPYVAEIEEGFKSLREEALCMCCIEPEEEKWVNLFNALKNI